MIEINKEVGTLPGDHNEVSVHSISAEYVQNGDGNSSDEVQTLHISAEECGGGIYYVLKTDRWAIDEIDDLIKVLEDFKKKSS